MTKDRLLFKNTRNDIEKRHTHSRYVVAWRGVTDDAKGRRENMRTGIDGAITNS
jgi:hypothetical protein